MLKSALVRTDKQHHLTGAFAVFLGDRLIYYPVFAQRVAVNIQNDLDIRIFGEVFFYRLTRTVVRAGIARVIIDVPVVDDVQTGGTEDLLQLIADAYYIILGVLGAVYVAGLVQICARLGLSLAGRCMSDQSLHFLCREGYIGAVFQQLSEVRLIGGLVFDL